MAQNIIFIWITRNESSLKCFAQEIELISNNERCTVEIYVTHFEAICETSESDIDNDNDKYSNVTISSKRLSLIKGRPNAYHLFAEQISGI